MSWCLNVDFVVVTITCARQNFKLIPQSAQVIQKTVSHATLWPTALSPVILNDLGNPWLWVLENMHIKFLSGLERWLSKQEHLLFLPRTWIPFSAFITVALGDLLPSSDLCRHQVCTWYTDIHVNKALICIKEIFKFYIKRVFLCRWWVLPGPSCLALRRLMCLSPSLSTLIFREQFRQIALYQDRINKDSLLFCSKAGLYQKLYFD